MSKQDATRVDKRTLNIYDPFMTGAMQESTDDQQQQPKHPKEKLWVEQQRQQYGCRL